MNANDADKTTESPDEGPHLEEYKVLRKKIDITVGDIIATERWFIIGIASVWTWLFTNKAILGSLQSRLAWWIPVFLAAAGRLQTAALRRHLELICRYLREVVEVRLDLGWETWYEQQREPLRLPLVGTITLPKVGPITL